MGVNYCICAYNEERNIYSCLESLTKQYYSGKVSTFVCVNGCTDMVDLLEKSVQLIGDKVLVMQLM